MDNIKPITLLRNTDKLKQELKDNDGKIYITKNGQKDFVVLSDEQYQKLQNNMQNAVGIASKQEKQQCNSLGFVKVSARSIEVEVAHISLNQKKIEEAIVAASNERAKILVLPELCLTGYTCGDIFLNDELLDQVENSLLEIGSFSEKHDVFFAVGAPLRKDGKLFDCAVIYHKGSILGVVPKTYLSVSERRYFECAPTENGYIHIGSRECDFGTNLIFVDSDYRKLKIAIEIGDDLWAIETPSTMAAQAGADIILNLSASNETVGKADYRRQLISMTSARLYSAYVSANAGNGESTGDLVFSGHNMIAENGKLLSESPLFSMKDATVEIDVELLLAERKRAVSFTTQHSKEFKMIDFSMPLEAPNKLNRIYDKNPFIPNSKSIDLKRVQEILDMQSMGLVKRLKTIHQDKAVVGLSGGLDSTLALLVTVEAFKKLNYDRRNILAITMPAFGTSKRTHDNAVLLSRELGVSFKEINIGNSVLSHFKDIGHDPNNHNVAYENAQARERTQVLMDVANDENALMIGTGDLSELCLGWCTYNGDHMSNYGVNGSIPKTLVRYLVEGYAILHPETKPSLLDIIETPISPELLPTDSKGEIAQITEDKVGPYELNDFFIYYYLRYGFSPKKIFFLSKNALKDKYDDATIKKWLRIFFNRFFKSQFKRNCLPDGVKIGSVGISPRGDLIMPSDANVDDFLKEIDNL